MGERLRDKVAIVTGASRGIGAAIAANMAEEGAKVVLVSRKIEGLQAAADEIRGQGGEAMPIACHVGHPDQRQDMLEQALKAYGKVDILVNNAATNPHFGPMLTIGGGAWDKTFEVNVKGYFGMIQLVVGHLQKRKAKGSVVNVASVAGLRGRPPGPPASAWCARNRVKASGDASSGSTPSPRHQASQITTSDR